MDTHAAANTMLNRFLSEMLCYKKVFPAGMTVYPGSMASAELALRNRIHRSIDAITNAYAAYSGQADPETAFMNDYPALRPLVEGLAGLQVKNGSFDMQDLLKLADTLTPTPAAQAPAPAQKAPSQPSKNPFGKFAP